MTRVFATIEGGQNPTTPNGEMMNELTRFLDDPGLRLNRRQEANVLHMHRVVDRYLTR